MVFFLGLLHGITQFPIEIMKYGLSHCGQGYPPVTVSANAKTISQFKVEKLAPLLERDIGIVKRDYPSLTQAEIDLFDQHVKRANTLDWSKPQTFVVFANFYDATIQKAVCYGFAVTSVDLPAGKVGLITIPYSTVASEAQHVFGVTSWIDIKGEISDVKTSAAGGQENFNENEIHAFAQTLYPVLFGIEGNTAAHYLFVNAVSHLIPLIGNYHTKLPYITATDAELTDSLQRFQKMRYIDLQTIYDFILQKCNEPTPTPTPIKRKIEDLSRVFASGIFDPTDSLALRNFESQRKGVPFPVEQPIIPIHKGTKSGHIEIPRILIPAKNAESIPKQYVLYPNVYYIDIPNYRAQMNAQFFNDALI